MDHQPPELILEEYLMQGIVNEIFHADQAKAMCTEIGNHASQLNSRGYGELFGSLQVTYSDTQTLCIAKIFDSANSKYPTFLGRS